MTDTSHGTGGLAFDKTKRSWPNEMNILLALIITLGFMLNNLTSPPDQSPFTIYVFSWLAGLALQLAAWPRPDNAENRARVLGTQL